MGMGVTTAGLPPSLGGTWSGMSEWVAQRQQLDQSLAGKSKLYLPNPNQLTKTKTDLGDESSPSKQPPSFCTKPSATINRSELVESPLINNTALPSWANGLTKGEITARIERDADKFPASQKAAYAEAFQKVRELVRTESDPLLFLRVDDRDCQSAAHRLTKYWTKRKALFGDRALLPLNLTGKGALMEEEIAVLEDSYLVFLPNDDKGRTVLHYHHDGNIAFGQRIGRFRCAFYMLSVAMHERRPMTLLRSTSVSNFAQIRMEKFLELVSSFPTSVERIVFVCDPPSDECGAYMDTVIPIIKQAISKFYPNALNIVCSTSPEGFSEKLNALGFSEEGLPEWLGGSWTRAQFGKWLQHRRTVELVLSQAAKDHVSSGDDAEDANLPRRVRKRKTDALYACERRLQEKEDADELQQRYLVLQKQRTSLEREEKRLLGLLAEAHKLTAQFGTPGGDKRPSRDCL